MDTPIRDTTIRASLLFLVFVALIWGMHATAALLAPFAMAVFIWLIIDAFARWLDKLSDKIPYWLALAVAVLSVVAGIVGIVLIIAETAQDVTQQAPKYRERLGDIFSWVSHNPLFTRFLGEDVTFTELSDRFALGDKLQAGVAGFFASVQGVISELAIIALYVVFLFAAQSSFPKKMDDLFPDQNRRAQASKVGVRIRHSIEKYLGVQTVISLIQTVLSYIIMASMGLDNALFWALVIFILNYIPIIGGLAAVVMPVTFALVQFESLPMIGLLTALLFGVQFIIGNTVQPKMMGDSMNLSALVVVLSLTLWGALLGGVGAFLSAPFTVIIMIILAQFPTTRWIAVLLSADGQPDLDPDEKKARDAMPSL